MKKTALFLALLLLAILVVGCSGEKRHVSIETVQDSPVPALRSAHPTEKAQATEEPTIEPSVQPELEYVTLSYDGKTALARVTSVFLNEEGKLTVLVSGSGFGFNGMLSIRNNKIVVPFGADVRIGTNTYGWQTAQMGGETIMYYFDRSDMPDQVILYSNDNKDKQFVFDAKPFIQSSPSAEASAEPDVTTLSGLAGRWSGTGRPVGDGEEIHLKISLKDDGTGVYRFQQGDYTERYSVFINEEFGSFSADIPADNALKITGCGGTYAYDGTTLSLHIVTEFASGRTFTYNVDCQRVPPAETVTDEPYTMVTEKFSVAGVYTGEWRDGKPNGVGTLTIQETNDRWDTGDTLWSEEWEDGLIEGYGEWRSAVDGAYDGNFVAGLKDGYGKMWFGDGKVFDGQWAKGAFVG